MTEYRRTRIPGKVDAAAVSDVSPPPISSTVAVWWAGDLVLANDDPVSTWTDRVNSVSLTASGTVRPTYKVAGFPGDYPSVYFDGTNDTLSRASSLSSASSGCVVAVVAINNPSSAPILWEHLYTVGGVRYLIGSTVSTSTPIRLRQRNNDAADGVSGDTAVVSGDAVAFEWSSNGSAWALRHNNVTQSLTVDAGSNTGEWFNSVTSADRFSIGAFNTNSNYTQGHVAYLGVFSAELSSSDRANLYQWIKDNYGITGITV